MLRIVSCELYRSGHNVLIKDGTESAEASDQPEWTCRLKVSEVF